MNRLAVFWQSSVGKKAVMAVTGLILVAYLITHVLANLLVFSGPERINRYAQLLHSSGAALWGARLILLAALILHIIAATQLAIRSRAARPEPYAGGRDPLGRSAHPAVPDLPHPPLHHRHGAPGFRRAEPAPQRQHRIPQPPGGSRVPARDAGGRPPPLPWSVEQRPEPGSQPAVAPAAPPAGRPGSGGLRLARLHRDRDRGFPRADPRRMRETCACH
jgi:hypothetical protein